MTPFCDLSSVNKVDQDDLEACWRPIIVLKEKVIRLEGTGCRMVTCQQFCIAVVLSMFHSLHPKASLAASVDLPLNSNLQSLDSSLVQSLIFAE